MDNPKINIYAQQLYEYALVAYYCQNDHISEFKEKQFHEQFKKLAELLGYKVEKMDEVEE